MKSQRESINQHCHRQLIRSIHHYVDTVDSLLNLKHGTFAKIENENYKKYAVKCLIDRKPIKLYVDSIVRDYHEDRKDGDLPIKYVVKLKYFPNEYASTSFSEMMDRGYFPLINEWRKTSPLFPMEFSASMSKYYNEIYDRNFHFLENVDSRHANDRMKFLKTWFKVHCSNIGERWCPLKIADIGMNVMESLEQLPADMFSL